VEKGERLEVSFDIKGSGEVDAEALNRFHGVHFGDEIESDDLPTMESDSEETEAEAETTEAPASAEDASDEAEEDSAPKMKFREDMLLRVMEAAGINVDHRDAFVDFAAAYDHDDNGYLKKAELEDAATAWNEANGTSDDGDASADDDAPAEEEPAEAVAEASEADEKACPICSTMVATGAATCGACGYTFTE
jgi:ribosomal protein L12E/L44/L45/RPP1/RPP2